MALYEIELAWGNGIIDLGKIRATLTGTEPCTDQDHDTPELLGKKA
jgi:hypothetical protein